MLGLCERLEKEFDVPAWAFRLVFVFWALGNFPTALLCYIVLSFII